MERFVFGAFVENAGTGIKILPVSIFWKNAVLRAKLDNCTPPPAEEVWVRLKEKMPLRSRIKTFNLRRQLLPGLAAAAIVLFLAIMVFSLSNPRTVRALGYRVKDGITVLLLFMLMRLMVL
ncbi:MAG: hypothetical protein K6U04_12780 [Armatimonadetes bacterium]|nr:hypothetical protein [Armatimonadota bacterium]